MRPSGRTFPPRVAARGRLAPAAPRACAARAATTPPPSARTSARTLGASTTHAPGAGGNAPARVLHTTRYYKIDVAVDEANTDTLSAF